MVDISYRRTLIDDAHDESDVLLEDRKGNDYYTTKKSKIEEEVEFEDAISRTGYGRFHYTVLLLCGWAISSDAIELLSISFVLPPAGCELALNSFDKGVLNSIIFVGMMIGGYVWGSLSDIFGRKSILVWSLALNALGGLAASFAQNFYMFLFLRLISGIGVGGSQPVIFSYFVEFQPKARRGTMVSALASFWVSGNIIAAGLAWAVIPQTTWYLHAPNFTYDSWRIYLAICTIPSATSAVLFLVMPESPKFLLQCGRVQEALVVLKGVYRQNQRRDPSFYDVRSLAPLINATTRRPGNIEEVGRVRKCFQICSRTVKQFLRKTTRLFERGLLRTTIVSCYVYVTLSFGYYGLFMWLPELFNRMDQFGGSACDMNYSINSSIPTTLAPRTDNSTCTFDHSNKIYFEGFITALSTMPGNILAILIMDRVGGRLMMAAAMVGAGVSVFFLWFVSNETDGIIMSCVFGGVSNIGWVALDVVVVEVFPTQVRSTAMGALAALARVSGILGNVAFGALVTTNCAVPMFLVMIFLATGGLAALLLPNKCLKPID